MCKCPCLVEARRARSGPLICGAAVLCCAEMVLDLISEIDGLGASLVSVCTYVVYE